MLRYFGITPEGTVTEIERDELTVENAAIDDLFEDESVATVQVTFTNGTHARVERDNNTAGPVESTSD